MNSNDLPRRLGPADLPLLPPPTPRPPAPRSNPPGATAGRPRPTALGQYSHCPCCDELTESVAINKPNGEPYYIWRICETQRSAWRISDAKIAQMDAERRQALAEQALGDPGLSRIAHLSLDTFEPDRLIVAPDDENPHTLVCDWLEAIRDLREGNYHVGKAVALYLYYDGKGTGKTHLAAGAALRARSWGKLSVFIEEASYLSRSWSVPFEDKEQMVALPGDLAWLTVIDDLGQNPPGKDPSSVQKVWYDVINRRWLRRGWTIITSNWTMEELANRGTLSEAAYSRLHQMTRGETLLVAGDDQRLRGRA